MSKCKLRNSCRPMQACGSSPDYTPCPIVEQSHGPLDLEYRAGKLSFKAHAFEFPGLGWDCAYTFDYRSAFDGMGSGKGAWEHHTVATKPEAIASVLRYMLSRMERELRPDRWSEEHKNRNAAFEKFRLWLLDHLQVWEMPLFQQLDKF